MEVEQKMELRRVMMQVVEHERQGKSIVVLAVMMIRQHHEEETIEVQKQKTREEVLTPCLDWDLQSRRCWSVQRLC